jgi:hypothetical protein
MTSLTSGIDDARVPHVSYIAHVITYNGLTLLNLFCWTDYFTSAVSADVLQIILGFTTMKETFMFEFAASSSIRLHMKPYLFWVQPRELLFKQSYDLGKRWKFNELFPDKQVSINPQTGRLTESTFGTMMLAGTYHLER